MRLKPTDLFDFYIFVTWLWKVSQAMMLSLRRNFEGPVEWVEAPSYFQKTLQQELQ